MFSSPVLNAFSLNGNGKTHSCLSGDARLSHSPLLPLVLLTKPVIIVGYLKHTSMSGKTEFLFQKEVLLEVEIPLEAMKLRCFIILSGCRVCKWSYSTSPGWAPSSLSLFRWHTCHLDKRMKILCSVSSKCHHILQFCTSLENSEFMLSLVVCITCFCPIKEPSLDCRNDSCRWQLQLRLQLRLPLSSLFT